MKSLAPDLENRVTECEAREGKTELEVRLVDYVAQFAVELSLSQQMESVKPASLVQSVEPVLVEGTWTRSMVIIKIMVTTIIIMITWLGTLLSPKAPTAKQMLHLPLSLLQQMEYLWLERWVEVDMSL